MSEVTVEYRENDPVTRLMKESGIPVNNYYLSGTSIVTGGSILLSSCELVYRVDNDDTVMIVFYRRLNDAFGLRNSFRDLVGFCGLIAEKLPVIRYITGKAEPMLAAAGDGISKERLLAMYRRHIGTELRGGWLYFDLDDYRYQDEKASCKRLQWINRVLKRNN